jgi:hypothetical protein
MSAELHSDLAPDILADVQSEVTNGHGSAEPPEPE